MPIYDRAVFMDVINVRGRSHFKSYVFIPLKATSIYVEGFYPAKRWSQKRYLVTALWFSGEHKSTP